MRLISALMFVLFTSAAYAAAPNTPLPTGADLISLDDLEPGGYWARGQIVEVKGQPFERAWRVQTRRKPGDPWGVLLKGVLTKDVPAGHLVWVTFMARSAVEAGSPPAAMALVKAQGGALDQRFSVGNDWRRMGFAYRLKKPIEAGQTKFEFFLGYQAQTIEIGGLEVLDLGPDAKAETLPKFPLWRYDPRDGREPAPPSRYREALFENELAKLPRPRFLVDETEESARERYDVTAQFVRYKIVPANNRPYGEAVELKVFNRPGKHWQAQFVAENTAPIKAGDPILIAFDARATSSAHASGNGRATVMLSKNRKPYTKSFSHPIEIEPGWQRYLLRGVALEDYAPGEAKVEFWVGNLRQTLEIGGLTVMAFDPSVPVTDLPTIDLGLDYPGREPDASWRRKALERIEAIRKSDLTIEVLDAEGNPVKDAEVRVEQTRQDFVFGTTLDTRQLLPSQVGEESAKKHEELLTSGMFNLLIPGNELKWAAFAGSYGPFYRPKRADWAVEWGEERGITIKGHVMVWNLPGPVRRSLGDKARDPAVVQQAVKDRIFEIGERFKGRLPVWDVINENYKHRGLVEIVGHDAVADWFRWAKEASGGAKLFWNEIHVLPETERGANVRAYTMERIKHLQKLGAPIDGFGIQGHLSVSSAPPPEVILKRLDEFATLGLEIQATEFDVNIRDTQDPDQLAFQADYVRDFTTVMFSHPSVTGVIYWTPSPYKWIPNSALTNKDSTLRPHGEVWKRLVTEDWRTDESLATDDQGLATLRAFHGDHRITVKHHGKTAKATARLTADGGTVEITLPALP